MKTRQLGYSDLGLTTVGFGAEDIKKIERLLLERQKKIDST